MPKGCITIVIRHIFHFSEKKETYSDEGLKVVAEGIKRNFGYYGELLFVMGYSYNKAI